MNVTYMPFFTIPVMEVHLDLDLEKLTEFAFELWNNDKRGKSAEREESFLSRNILKEEHEEFIKLKKEIDQYLQTYHLKVFRGMEFKESVIQKIDKTWVNINEKHHFTEWHIHGGSTLSGVYYIKHDNSSENGDIVFKNPSGSYMTYAHWWPKEIVEKYNEISSPGISVTPRSNMLLIFPSWLEHKAEANLKNDYRISLSFNSTLSVEKKS